MPPLTSALLLAAIIAAPDDAPSQPDRSIPADLRSPAGVDAAARGLLVQPSPNQPRHPETPLQETPLQETRLQGMPRRAQGESETANTSIPAFPFEQNSTTDMRVPLPPRPKTDGLSRPEPPSPGSAFASVAASLCLVLGLFFIVVWFARRGGRVLNKQTPDDVLEVLGQSQLSVKTQMHVVRFGNKLVLLAATSENTVSLAEITDPIEVDRLAGVCKSSQSNSITTTFRQMLGEMNKEPAPRSFLGDEVKRAASSTAVDAV